MQIPVLLMWVRIPLGTQNSYSSMSARLMPFGRACPAERSSDGDRIADSGSARPAERRSDGLMWVRIPLGTQKSPSNNLEGLFF